MESYIMIKFKYDILDTHTFKYEDNRVHNPYGRYGKIKLINLQ